MKVLSRKTGVLLLLIGVVLLVTLNMSNFHAQQSRLNTRVGYSFRSSFRNHVVPTHFKRDDFYSDSMLDSSQQDGTEHVFAWAVGNGAIISPKVSYSNVNLNGTVVRGLIVTEPVQSGEVLISIPSTLLLFTRNHRNTSISDVLLELENEGIRPAVVLVLMVLHQLIDPLSHWSLYLSDFSRVFVPSPIFATEKALVGLPETLRHMTEDQRSLLRDEYNLLFPRLTLEYPHIFGGEHSYLFSFKRFKIVSVVTYSRMWSLYLKKGDARKTDFLVPVMDLMNYGDVGIRIFSSPARVLPVFTVAITMRCVLYSMCVFRYDGVLVFA